MMWMRRFDINSDGDDDDDDDNSDRDAVQY